MAYGGGMIRISDLALPLDHASDALKAAAAARLGLAAGEIARVTVARRGNDARKRGGIRLVYTLDVALAEGGDEGAVWATFLPLRSVSFW